MKHEDVITFMEQGFNMALDMVADKGKFYHHHKDRLSHIKATAAATGLTPERSTHALVSKHFTALPDMLEHEIDYTMDEFDQYFIDILVYISYLRCLLIERRCEAAISSGDIPVVNATPLKAKAKK